MILRVIAAGALLALAVSSPVLAQGNSEGHRNDGNHGNSANSGNSGNGGNNGNNGNSGNNGNRGNNGNSGNNLSNENGPAPVVATPPSRNDLVAPSTAAVSSGGATPLAWLDDASVLQPGGVSVAISVLRWNGSGISEVNFPVVNIALGLTRRVQFSASVPHVIGSADPYGAAGGLGTSYFSSKIGLFDNGKSSVKVAVSPTLEVLSPGVVDMLPPGEHRIQLGLPISMEIERGPARIYGGTGYFTRGAWFTGAGGSYFVNDRVSVFGSLSRAWRRSNIPDVPLGERDRNEISGGASYSVSPAVHVFGSIGRTIATLEENGAGRTIAVGVSFFVMGGASK
jgi:hypothetical protein